MLRFYHIATNSFLADGGDGLRRSRKAGAVYSGGYYVSNAIVDYFKAGNTITDEQLKRMRCGCEEVISPAAARSVCDVTIQLC